MTQPDQYFPDTAINSSPGFAAYSTMTQADYEDMINGQVEAPWGVGGLLGYLFAGLEAGKPFVVALIEAIVNTIFDGISAVFTTIEDAFEGLGSAFSGKWRDIINAKDAADYANAQLAAMNRLIVDTFDGPAGSLSANWDTVGYDIGAGTTALDGNGNAWWSAFGGLGHGEWHRYNALQTVGDAQQVFTVMPLRVQDPLLGSDSYSYLLGRVVNTGDPTTFVYAQIGNNSVEIGCAVSGSITVFDSDSVACQDSDSWEFDIGTDIDDYEFVLYRNGRNVLDVYDGSHVSYKGAGYRSVGFGQYAGARLGFLSQTSPGTMAVFSADDAPWGS